MKAQDYQISSEKFVFHTTSGDLHDTKLETKPVSYFRDALNRFAKNKASIVAAAIIAFLMLFAAFGPLFTPYRVADEDMNYALARPKNKIFYNLGIHFWDGGQEKKELTKKTYKQYEAIQIELGREVIMGDVEYRKEVYMGKDKEYYSFRLDTYNSVGVIYVNLPTEKYIALQQYQDKHNVQVILPYTYHEPGSVGQDQTENANLWYKTEIGSGLQTEIVYDEYGNFIPAYKADDGTDMYFSTQYHEGDEKIYSYAEPKDNGTNWKVRVDYLEYYKYKHAMAGDKIKEPCFLFGANHAGKDIFVCLASGARFSFILAILVSSINLLVGAIYGAIEGYYGGKIDILMERFVEILSAVPFMIVITLLKYHFEGVSQVLILFIAFFITGWTGMAARTRMQFYRFKNQEYVLVARTLGANDRRIMFKHIFPNALGTLITGSVLVIPGVIFSETSLSYLNIISLSTGNLTSVGTLLATSQTYLTTDPHTMLFPSLFISLLMLSFNLFGNGLRDAFNPSLRGTE